MRLAPPLTPHALMIHHDKPEFGEVRSLLHGEPGAEGWRKLCRLIERWDGHELRQVVLPYVDANLRRWPDAMRLAQGNWLDLKLAGAEPVYWGIARGLDCEGRVLERGLCEELTGRVITPGISALSARGAHIGAKEMEAFTRSAAMEHLRVMDWSMTPLDADSIGAMIDSERLRGVERLAMSGCRQGNEGLVTLAQAPHLDGLRTLELQDARLGLMAIRALGEATFAPQLRALDLSDNYLGRHGALRLTSAGGLRELGALRLKNCELGLDGMGALLDDHAMTALTELDLEHNNLRSEGLALLAGSDMLSTVRHLRLGYNRIGDEGIDALIDSSHRAQLTRVWLHWNPLTQRSAERLDEAGIHHDLSEADWTASRWAR